MSGATVVSTENADLFQLVQWNLVETVQNTIDSVIGSTVQTQQHCLNMGNYSNSGFDRSSFLKTDNSNEFSSSCTTRIVPILTTGVSFLRSYKVSNKRPIMGHPRSDLGQPRSVLVGPGQSQDGLVCLRMVQDSLKPAQVWLG